MSTQQTIVLIGFMGCGKSSVARTLSWRLQIPAIDLDTEIEKRAGCSVADFFRQHGEDQFRLLETQVLGETLDAGSIIATGGGIVKCDENRHLLKQASARGAHIIYLQAPADKLAERIRRQPGKRPLIDGDRVLDIEETRARVEQLLQERGPLYQSVATLVVETEHFTPAGVADYIAEKIGI
jgi:shikimate kinase